MLIVLLAWLYVVVLFACGQNSLPAAVAVLLFFGVLPLSMLAWLLRRRRRVRLARLEKRVKT